MAVQEIKVGDTVRSYDNKYRESYVEGLVVGFGELEGCPRYKISVFKMVERDGTDSTKHAPEYVLPPVNGTPKLFGGVCDFVEKIA